MKMAWVLVVGSLLAGCCSSPSSSSRGNSGFAVVQVSQPPAYTFQKVIEASDGGTVFLEMVPESQDP